MKLLLFKPATLNHGPMPKKTWRKGIGHGKIKIRTKLEP
jgi:hypothetical protein